MVTVLSLVLTACSDSSDDVDADLSEDLRNNIAITIYGITGDDSTEEAIAMVEEKISNYCFALLKAKIDLRLYKRSEYQAALDAMYEKFNEQDEKARLAAEQAASASKSLRDAKKKMSPEELTAYEKKEREAARAKEKEAKKVLAEQQALIRAGRDEAVLNEVQMDILYIPTADDYYSWIKEGLLVDLSEQLRTTLGNISKFEYPAFLTAATTDSGIYGIPNNKAVTTDYTYLVANTALAEKYEVNWDEIRSITDLEEVFALIKANEKGVTPILGDFEPEDAELVTVPGVTHYGYSLAVAADQLLGGRFTTYNVKGDAVLDNYWKTFNRDSTYSKSIYNFAELKWTYRSKGYLSQVSLANYTPGLTELTEAETSALKAGKYFVAVKEMTEEKAEALTEAGLTVIPYKGARFTTEDALNGGLYGISVRSAQKIDRVAEVLNLFVTDSTFRNLFAFGVEDVHYVKESEHSNIITVIDDSYSMDFYGTGNTFIGFVPDTMDPDYVEKGIQKNIDSRIDPQLGFTFDWDDPENNMGSWFQTLLDWEDGVRSREKDGEGNEVLETWPISAAEAYKKIMYGVEDYDEIFYIVGTRKDDGGNLTEKYTDLTSTLFRTAFGNNYKRLLTLDASLHPEIKE